MSEVSRHVGGRIRLYRKLKNYTLDYLALMIHKSKATLSKYETGDIILDVETLFEVARVLGVSVQQLLDYDPVAVRETEGERSDGFFSGRYAYLYFYDGRIGKIVRNLLELRREGSMATASLYYDLLSFEQPERCMNLYFGKAEFYDTVTNFSFESQSNRMERVQLTAMNPFDRSTRVLALMSGMSRNTLLPISIKCSISTEPLEEDEELKSSLMLTPRDMKLIRKLNMFAVE